MIAARKTASLLAGACLGIVGCAGAADSDASLEIGAGAQQQSAAPSEARQAVTLKFKATVGDQPLACGKSYARVGTKPGSAQVRDFRFFVSSVRLVAEDGREVPLALDERGDWQTADLALLDFADDAGQCADGDPGTNLTVTGTVPAGRYKGVIFVNGVPETLNHADPTFAPAPLAQPGVSWSWLLGYKFLIADVIRDDAIAKAAATPSGGHMAMADAGAAGGMDMPTDGGMMNMDAPGVATLHLGSTACTGAPPKGVVCSRPNRNEVRLDGFDPAKNTIVADLGAIFAKSDLVTGALCHSGGELCGPMFSAVGVAFESGSPLKTQRVFHVE